MLNRQTDNCGKTKRIMSSPYDINDLEGKELKLNPTEIRLTFGGADWINVDTKYGDWLLVYESRVSRIRIYHDGDIFGFMWTDEMDDWRVQRFFIHAQHEGHSVTIED